MRIRRRGRPAAIPTESTVLRRTTRRAAVQTALALGVVLALVGVVLYIVEVNIQQDQIDTQLAQVVAHVDDVDDPPPGMAIAIRDRKGAVMVSDHAPTPTAPAVAASAGYRNLRSDGVDYRALVADSSGRRIAVLVDLTPWQEGRLRLLMALLAAEAAGLAAAAGVAVLLSRRAIRPLAAALGLQRRFVADASHELRAPLTVLHTRAQLLARRAERDRFDETLTAQLRDLVSDTRALADIVDDLLLAASTQHEPGRAEHIDLLRLCHEVRDSVGDYAADRDIAVEVTSGPPTGELIVEGTRPALRRAILALVDNALSHENPGGTITLRVARAADRIDVTVSDTGVGLDPQDVDRLFLRFAHGDGHSAGARPHGIGLALVREVVEAHHGRISVDGAPGRGAAFTLHLPAATN
ncbi:sensor histidine kinase [Nocardia sp. NPDC052278]|uniref:sensor histidine kinase n=1 Tax=unclassified Nocardia TaxID=2637762 RepID=UPI0036B72C7E